MKASKLIEEIQKEIDEHGDLEIVVRHPSADGSDESTPYVEKYEDDPEGRFLIS